MAQTDIYESLLTPCFVFDAEEMRKSVDGFRKALEKNFSKAVVGYSVKTNSLPYCVSKAREFGAYAEVVSHDEYELALLCGFPSDKIIYNGPLKSEETFFEAIEGGAIVNIETKRELQWLKSLNPNKMHKVGLRLSINLGKVSPEDADGYNDDSRFGFSDATGEFSDALNVIASLPNVRLAGLHIHRTVHSRSVRFYERSVAYACGVIKKYGMAIDYLDIGGGFFGIFPGKPTFQQYSDAIYGVLQSNGLEDLCLIVEPGNALVASSCTFVSEVIDVKQSESELWYVTTNGSRNDIDPFFRKTEYLDEEIYQHSILPPPILKKQVVTGCTCLEYDRLFTLTERPKLSVGDKIVYHNVGAYTMSLIPMFIRYIPRVYALENGECKVVREKWAIEEYVQKSIIK